MSFNVFEFTSAGTYYNEDLQIFSSLHCFVTTQRFERHSSFELV